jgi:hypothetical protein
MDEESKILHLRLAVIGGFVIFAFGLVSFLFYHHLPILSFTVGPLISLTSWRALQGFQRRKSFVEIRLSSARDRRRKF